MGNRRGRAVQFSRAASLAGQLLILTSVPSSGAEEAGALATARAETAKAIEEQRIFLNCSALDARMNGDLLRFWREDVADAAKVIAQSMALRTYLSEFVRDTALSNIVLPDGPVSERIAFCAKQGDWQGRYNRFDFIILKFRLGDIAKNAK